jgi:hypothetical protein
LNARSQYLLDTWVVPTKIHNLVIAQCMLLCGGESFDGMEDFGLAMRE